MSKKNDTAGNDADSKADTSEELKPPPGAWRCPGTGAQTSYAAQVHSHFDTGLWRRRPFACRLDSGGQCNEDASASSRRALEEHDFLSSCIKCGQCVQVCPVAAIKLGDIDEGFGVGVPYIDARNQACDFSCDAVQCILACPTGALTYKKPGFTNTRDGMKLAHDPVLKAKEKDAEPTLNLKERIGVARPCRDRMPAWPCRARASRGRRGGLLSMASCATWMSIAGSRWRCAITPMSVIYATSA